MEVDVENLGTSEHCFSLTYVLTRKPPRYWCRFFLRAIHRFSAKVLPSRHDDHRKKSHHDRCGDEGKRRLSPTEKKCEPVCDRGIGSDEKHHRQCRGDAERFE